jgi:hypothetical protein
MEVPRSAEEERGYDVVLYSMFVAPPSRIEFAREALEFELGVSPGNMLSISEIGGDKGELCSWGVATLIVVSGSGEVREGVSGNLSAEVSDGEDLGGTRGSTAP